MLKPLPPVPPPPAALIVTQVQEAPLIAVFGLALVRCLASKTWASRVAALAVAAQRVEQAGDTL